MKRWFDRLRGRQDPETGPDVEENSRGWRPAVPLWPVPTLHDDIRRELGDDWLRENTPWVQLQVAYLEYVLKHGEPALRENGALPTTPWAPFGGPGRPT